MEKALYFAELGLAWLDLGSWIAGFVDWWIDDGWVALKGGVGIGRNWSDEPSDREKSLPCLRLPTLTYASLVKGYTAKAFANE